VCIFLGPAASFEWNAAVKSSALKTETHLGLRIWSPGLGFGLGFGFGQLQMHKNPRRISL